MEMKKRAFEFSRNKTVKKKCEIPIQKIKKFEAKALDWFWFRFQNLFETEIDQVQICPISKFFYFKELLVPNVDIWVTFYI